MKNLIQPSKIPATNAQADIIEEINTPISAELALKQQSNATNSSQSTQIWIAIISIQTNQNITVDTTSPPGFPRALVITGI
ncbi:hypothetical protein F7R13_02450 [Burkholderia territorii]|uniref:Uncharacterized protein n=1 Tax=Burkholderia territorii TaxID=1503055 RepID=A0A6L3NQ62_9BURK|nr:hypothetical protein F7R13_02450 [Burkholderia territorii]